MVAQQLELRGIRDQRLLDAMSSVPRELFVPEPARHLSYADEPISIGHGQTISQPYITALMVEALELNGEEKVLEIGAGSGYHAAVLGKLAARIISLELVPALAADARRNLKRAGLGKNVKVIAGDGSVGYPAEAPYEAISVAAGAPAVPESLLDQLTDQGRIVIPVGSREEQELLVISKSGGETSSRVATRCRFVPLRGGEGWRGH
jgi:protein-L-isoaspartate(D-aspartate) O-methyltransferase